MFFLADSGNKMDENDVITDYSCTEDVAACLLALKHQVWFPYSPLQAAADNISPTVNAWGALYWLPLLVPS